MYVADAPYSPPTDSPCSSRATQQQRRRQQAEPGRDQRDHQRAAAHHRHRQRERRATSGAVGIHAEQQRADGPGDETHGEDGRRAEQLRGLVARREERARKIDGEGRVREPVEPLDEVAGRTAEDVLESLCRGHRPPPRPEWRDRRHHGVAAAGAALAGDFVAAKYSAAPSCSGIVTPDQRTLARQPRSTDAAVDRQPARRTGNRAPASPTRRARSRWRPAARSPQAWDVAPCCRP